MAEDGTGDFLQQLNSNSNSNTTHSKWKLLEARLNGGQGMSDGEAQGWSLQASPVLRPASPGFAEREADMESDSEGDNAEGFSIQINPLKRKSISGADELGILNLEGNQDLERIPEEEKVTPVGKRTRRRQAGGHVKSQVTLPNHPLRNSTRQEKHKDRQPATINKYFPKVENGVGDVTVTSRSDFVVHQECQTEASLEELKSAWTKEREAMKRELMSAKETVRATEEKMIRVKQEADELQAANEKLHRELQDYKELQHQRDVQRMRVVADVLVTQAKAERHEARKRLRQEAVRLGNVGVMRAGTVISEVWEDGQAFKDFAVRLQKLMEQKAAIERSRKDLKRKPPPDADGQSGPSEDEVAIAEETFRIRLAAVKKEEESITRDKERCEVEKSALIREMKRIRDEDASRFNHYGILNKRYALLNLLGKGGFSEVYKAFDLVDFQFVACKLHQLNPGWSEEKKQSYVRHAIREYHIHKKLNHPRIVRLFDIFEIDNNTFCTVLEYCEGKDLDAVLKATPILAEREARCLIVQIFSGLAYLNNPQHRVIHYDLKPGNILFDVFGEVKITDFGLSKVMEEEGASQGMELTSQGAGTYWYLPPECFEIGKQPPMISSKVDVWSAGVIFYQMLFGRRPFGHDQTQEKILREETIRHARSVEFPPKPLVSQEAKEFIRRCLTYKQRDRPDVLKIASDPYLSYLKKKG